MKTIKLLLLFLASCFFFSFANAGEGIPPDYKSFSEIFSDDSVDIEAAYDALTVYRNYFRLQGEGYTRASLLQAFIVKTDKALGLQPKNAQLLYIKGYSHYLYIRKSRINLTDNEKDYHKKVSNESFEKSLEYDGVANVILTKGMLRTMTQKASTEVRIIAAEKFIERHTNDYDIHDRLPLIDVYYELSKRLIMVGRFEEAEEISKHLKTTYLEKHGDYIINRINAISERLAKKRLEQEKTALTETDSSIEENLSSATAEEKPKAQTLDQTPDAKQENKQSEKMDLADFNSESNIQTMIREYGPIVAIIIVVLLYLRSRRALG